MTGNTRTAALIVLGGVVVDELDDRHIGTVAEALAKLQNPRITAGALADLLSDIAEKHLKHFLILDHLRYLTTRMHRRRAFLLLQVRITSARDHRFDYPPRLAGLRQRGTDSLVFDQCSRKRGKRCLAVACGTAEPSSNLIVSHDSSALVFNRV